MQSMRQWLLFVGILAFTNNGIKVSVRANSHNSYICDFNVYMGKEHNRVEVGLGESDVLKLCDSITGKYFHIYFYTARLSSRSFLRKDCTHVAQSIRIGNAGQRT